MRICTLWYAIAATHARASRETLTHHDPRTIDTIRGTAFCLADFLSSRRQEIDPTIDPNELAAQNGGVPGAEDQGNLMAELTSSIPGIDEAMSFAELMKQVQTMEYSVIVFDTAPTGHTLRLIQFPQMLEKGLGRVLGMKDKFGGLLSTVPMPLPFVARGGGNSI